jgi:RNA polymerase sigma-70 factor, ECF subfamily
MQRRKTFLQLVLEHERAIKAFIGSLVRDNHMRDDVFQETALALWEQFDRYDAQRPFGAWARGVASNKILQRRHADRRFPLAFSPEAIQAVLDAFEQAESDSRERSDALEECLEQLPDRSQQLLRLRYGEDLRGEKISRRTGQTVEAIYQALSRIRAILERCIETRLGVEGARLE